MKFKNYLFLDREEGREKERERNINVWLSLTCPRTGDLAHNPGVCPDWESNQRPFGSQARAQSTEPHQPGNKHGILKIPDFREWILLQVFTKWRHGEETSSEKKPMPEFNYWLYITHLIFP